ncbi:MAG: 3-hydroxyacyl-ACP dehydratase FabZ [Beijerinckiaceae bacterium]|jgi:3-hydroxyacyl-[acyl-carrier-protein] dehydratase|nr:3-hydroxyacyl-ACP dehydratase FabZ [Beijerinckiaceae bacterium]
MTKADESGTVIEELKMPLDITQLMQYLPHRYPFLLIDRIVTMDADRYVVGIKNVTYNEPHFVGHFPTAPVMPGVLLIEGMAQTAGAACIASGEAGGGAKLVYFMTIDKCKFRKPVTPGDRVEYHLTRLSRRRNMWWYKGEAKVDGQLMAEAELSAMIVAQ